MLREDRSSCAQTHLRHRTIPEPSLSAVLHPDAMPATGQFLSPQAEATPATLEEAAVHGDMIFVEGGGGTDYRSIVYKTFALVQWVAANRQPKFVLKTDDDAYVHTANLIQTLRAVRAFDAFGAIRDRPRGFVGKGAKADTEGHLRGSLNADVTLCEAVTYPSASKVPGSIKVM